MAKGVRVNKVKKSSQKCFHKHQRIKKKQKKKMSEGHTKVALAAGIIEKTIPNKPLSTRQKKILKKQTQRKEKEKTRMEVSNETRKKKTTQVNDDNDEECEDDMLMEE